MSLYLWMDRLRKQNQICWPLQAQRAAQSETHHPNALVGCRLPSGLLKSKRQTFYCIICSQQWSIRGFKFVYHKSNYWVSPYMTIFCIIMMEDSSIHSNGINELPLGWSRVHSHSWQPELLQCLPTPDIHKNRKL
jgi:hypothetical protein